MNDLESVVLAQEFIETHYKDHDFHIDSVCNCIGYSRRQLDRLFVKYIGKTLSEYINAVVLSKSAEKLLNMDNRIIDIAFDSHFHSHEGYTRSFVKHFYVTPDEYRKRKIAIPLFTPHPANHYDILKEGQAMENIAICTVTPINRPKRKLIYLPSQSATDYFSYCEEVGCDWEGLLNSIPEKFDTASLIDLPDFLVKSGINKIAAGVEVPFDYDKPLPDGYKTVELPECIMLYFQSQPYQNTDDFGNCIGQVFKAIEKYNLAYHGYQSAKEIAPTLNLGAEPEIGARVAIPVLKKSI